MQYTIFPWVLDFARTSRAKTQQHTDKAREHNGCTVFLRVSTGGVYEFKPYYVALDWSCSIGDNTYVRSRR